MEVNHENCSNVVNNYSIVHHDEYVSNLTTKSLIKSNTTIAVGQCRAQLGLYAFWTKVKWSKMQSLIYLDLV